MVIPYDGETVTRWVLAWPDGSVERIYAPTGRECGPWLYVTKADADAFADTQTPRPKPVKVRVTIEVAK